MPIPLLILSDAPSTSSGLGRITRELSIRIHQNLSDVFEVATYGYGGDPSPSLPFKQYRMQTGDNYTPTNLPETWRDFAGDEKGVVLSIFNPAWTPWLADPETTNDRRLYEFLKSEPFKRWGYFPIDGDSFDGRLPSNLGEAMSKFDSVLAYTAYGANVINKSISHVIGAPFDCPHLPHGLDTSVFYPRDRKMARDNFAHMVAGVDAPIKDDVTMIGVVATNSPRKDWGWAFETAAELKRRGVNVGVWVHTDHLRKSWDIVMLAEEFGLTDQTIASNRVLNDEEMAWAYSAMDVTLGIGSEGWGMPIVESQGCGVPCVHMTYAGGAELVPEVCRVEPSGFRHDGFFAINRPCFLASDCADVVQKVVGTKSVLPPYIDWNNAWQRWSEWLKAGIS